MLQMFTLEDGTPSMAVLERADLLEATDGELTPFNALSAAELVEPFSMYCSKELRDLRRDVSRKYNHGRSLWTEGCQHARSRCDEEEIRHRMLAAGEAGPEFIEAISRRERKFDVVMGAQPAGTVNLTGELRLVGKKRFHVAESRDAFRCDGVGEYDMLSQGEQVTVLNAAGEKVALGELEQGYVWPMDEPAVQCRFLFDIEAAPDGPGVLSVMISEFRGPEITIDKYKNELLLLTAFLGDY